MFGVGGERVAQRLKQHNEGARLLLTPDDFLIARETPRSIGGVLRYVRRRIDRGGYAEQSVHEHECAARRFFHYWIELGRGQIAGLYPTLLAAQEAMAKVPVDEDPGGVCRCIEYWAEERPVVVRMQDDAGVPRFSVPAFEAAWRLVVQQFPDLSVER
jgi:hypothetical protein